MAPRWGRIRGAPSVGEDSGPSPVNSPEGAGTAVLSGRAALGQPRSGDRAIGDHSQPAPQADLPEWEARVPKNACQPARTGIRSARWCTRLPGAGSQLLGAPRVGPLHIRAWPALASWTVSGPGGPRRRGVWLVCCASRGGARVQPSCRSAHQLGPRKPDPGEFYRRAPAWCSPSLSGGGSPSRPVCRNPVLVRPGRAPLSGARPALSGAHPKEGGRLWLLLSQGRTGKETQDEPPARRIQFRRSAPLVPRPRGPGHWPQGPERGFPNKFGSRRPVLRQGTLRVASRYPWWFAEANRGPPKRTVGPPKRLRVVRRSGPVWPAEADQWDTCRVVHLESCLSAVRGTESRGISRRLSDTVPKPIPRGL